MREHADVLIVGGGAIGVSTAFSLAERGARVTLLERGDICSGASFGNAGWIVPSHALPLPGPGAIRNAAKWLFDRESPLYIQPRLSASLVHWLWDFAMACTDARMRRTAALERDLSVASQARYETLAALPELEFGYTRNGLLILCEGHEALEDIGLEVRIASDMGGEAVLLSAEEVRSRVPIAAATLVGGAYMSSDAHIDPAAFVTGLARVAEARGVRIHTHMEVLGLIRGGTGIAGVTATRGDFTCDQLVLAGGAWSPALLRGLGLRLPVQAAKGYSVTALARPEFGDTPIMLADAKVAMTPLNDHLRVAGTLELAGVNLDVNMRRVDALLRAVGRYLPGLGPLERVETWRGLRPLTPDDLPVIGRPRSFPNLCLAVGHGMRGMSQGPITGELVAQLLSGEPPEIDLTPFSPDRF